jgi:chemotaxis protein methyltransferase CheR
LGLDFPERRQADLERGLARAWRAAAVSAPEAYLAWLANLPDESPEWRRLASHLTVGETYFFRDRSCFEALEQQVLPPLIATRRAEGILRLRLWSAGCATGEEPYSLAILLDRLLPDRSEWALTILASDINPDALEAAQQRRYREWALRDTPAWIRDRYFHSRGGGTFELDTRIRRMVAFAPLNLAEGTYPAMVTNTAAMDLIVCRNVLMYFTHEAQHAAVTRLRMALVPGGWLVVNPAEASTELLHPLVPVNFPGAIFYRKESASFSPPVASWQPETGFPAHPDPFPFAPALEAAATPQAPVPSPSTAQAEDLPDPATLLRRARTLADRGDLEQARHLCQAAVGRDRLNPETHFLLAAICQERGEVPAALEALRRAIYLAPEFAPAHFLQGSLLLRQAKRRRGQRSMETVVRLLTSVPHDEPVPGSDGLTAGRLLEMARAYLEVR